LIFLELAMGIEPATGWLQIRRSVFLPTSILF